MDVVNSLKNSAIWIIVQYKYVDREMSHESCTKLDFFYGSNFWPKQQ